MKALTELGDYTKIPIANPRIRNRIPRFPGQFNNSFWKRLFKLQRRCRQLQDPSEGQGKRLPRREQTFPERPVPRLPGPVLIDKNVTKVRIEFNLIAIFNSI
jgi:hypothetical protein